MDVVLAIVLGVLTFAMGYMGIHVTLHPPETQDAKRKWKISFSVVAFAAVVHTGLQAYLAHKSSAALEAAIKGEAERTRSEIQKEADRPIIVQPQITVPSESRKSAKNTLPPLKHRALLLANKIHMFFTTTVDEYNHAADKLPASATAAERAQAQLASLRGAKDHFDQQLGKETAVILKEMEAKGLDTTTADNMLKETSAYINYFLQVELELRRLAGQIDLNGNLVQ